MTDSRQRFETHLEIPELMAQRDGDEYAVPFIQRYWQFWQAAEAQAVRRCAEIVCKGCREKLPRHPTEPEQYHATNPRGGAMVCDARAIRAEFPEAWK